MPDTVYIFPSDFPQKVTTQRVKLIAALLSSDAALGQAFIYGDAYDVTNVKHQFQCAAHSGVQYDLHGEIMPFGFAARCIKTSLGFWVTYEVIPLAA